MEKQQAKIERLAGEFKWKLCNGNCSCSFRSCPFGNASWRHSSPRCCSSSSSSFSYYYYYCCHYCCYCDSSRQVSATPAAYCGQQLTLALRSCQTLALWLAASKELGGGNKSSLTKSGHRRDSEESETHTATASSSITITATRTKMSFGEKISLWSQLAVIPTSEVQRRQRADGFAPNSETNGDYIPLLAPTRHCHAKSKRDEQNDQELDRNKWCTTTTKRGLFGVSWAEVEAEAKVGLEVGTEVGVSKQRDQRRGEFVAIAFATSEMRDDDCNFSSMLNRFTNRNNTYSNSCDQSHQSCKPPRLVNAIKCNHPLRSSRRRPPEMRLSNDEQQEAEASRSANPCFVESKMVPKREPHKTSSLSLSYSVSPLALAPNFTNADATSTAVTKMETKLPTAYNLKLEKSMETFKKRQRRQRQVQWKLKQNSKPQSKSATASLMSPKFSLVTATNTKTHLHLILLLALLLLLATSTRNSTYNNNNQVLVSAEMLATSEETSDDDQTIYVKVGILLEESDHEHANMFIRTIKMINERRDEAIRRLLRRSSGHNFAPGFSPTTSGEQTRQTRAPMPPAADRAPEVGAYVSSVAGSSFRGTGIEASDKAADVASAGTTSTSVSVPQLYDELNEAERRREQQQHQHQQEESWTKRKRRENSNSTSTNHPERDLTRSARLFAFAAKYKLGNNANQFNVKLEPVIEFLRDPNSSFEADNKVCQLIESGVRVVLGPARGASIGHVQSICDNLEIPYFELRPHLSSSSSLSAGTTSQQQQQVVRRELVGGRPSTVDFVGDTETVKSKAKNSEDTRQQQHQHQQQIDNDLQKVGLSLNLHPPAHLLNSAYIDLIYALNWTSFAIVYEDDSSMIKLQDLLRESSGSWTSKWRIKLFRHEASGGGGGKQTVGQHQSSTNITTSRSSGSIGSSGAQQSITQSSNGLGASGMDTPPMPAAAQWSQQERVGNIRNTTSSGESLSLMDYDGSSSIGMAANKITTHSGTTTTSTKSSARGPSKRTPTFRDVFWRVKSSGEKNILLDVSNENLYEALKHAQQVGLMTEEFSYLITSLDMHMIDMEDFKYSRTKITAFAMLQVAKSSTSSVSAASAFQSAAGHFAHGSSRENDSEMPMARMSSAGQSAAPTASTMTTSHSEQPLDQTHSHLFDEWYLERLGVRRPDATTGEGSRRQTSGLSRDGLAKKQHEPGAKQPRQRQRQFISPMQLDDSLPNANDLLNENDLARREMLQSLPASMGLLPTVDRNNEQKLFEFFIEQQERNMSHVRLSTSSAILHDSLILYLLGLYELDPSGHLLTGGGGGETADGKTTMPLFNQERVACSLSSRPWPHGSSLVNYMRQISFQGLSGVINFDSQGLRTDFKLSVMGLAPNIKQIKVGEWSSGERDITYYPSSRSQQKAQKNTQTATATTNQPEVDNTNRFLQQQQPSTSNGHIENPTLRAGSSYDELSSKYEAELKRYMKLLADGHDVTVPYTKLASKSGSLKVNEIIFDRLYKEPADQVDTLVVTSKLSQPYFMLKETPNRLEGNDQFEGYAVDLIHELSKLVNFRYKWQLAADGKYGSKELLPNGTIVWNGMIGEIVRGQADLAIVDLTITAQREEAVDFTLPFMNTGISILFKKPTTKVTTLFSFLSPFSSDVWAYVLAAYCGISAILFLVGHLSPYEWANPHPCRHIGEDDETVLKNQFSLLNSFWFTIGSLMQQGSDLTPRSMSTRTIAGIWYFFTLIMISSYTANLAAFLTVEKVVYPIENVRDLSQQQEIKYGCVESGSTCTFFHDSQIDTYKKIDETMRKYRTYVRSNDEGQKRVGEGKFAFFMESTTIEYIIERNCNLTQIGGLIDSKGYGLATSKKSRLKRPYRTLLNEGILHLQETGMLHVLKNRWWKERRGGGTCTDDGKGGGVTELSLANVGGVFVVLLGGLGISFLVAIAEFMWRARRSGSSRDRMCEEMMSDLKFALACKSSTKPINRSNSRSRSSCRLTQQQQQQQQNQQRQSLINGYGGGGICAIDDLGLVDPAMLLRPHLANRHRLQASALTLQQNNHFDNHFNNFTNNNNNSLLSYNHHHPNDIDAAGSSGKGAPKGDHIFPSGQLDAQGQGAQPPASSQTTKTTSTKDCDPILMHAMISLLVQQQQEQQEQMQLRRALHQQQQQFQMSSGDYAYQPNGGDLTAILSDQQQQQQIAESPRLGFSMPRSKSRQVNMNSSAQFHLPPRSKSQQNLASNEVFPQSSTEEYSNETSIGRRQQHHQLFQGHQVSSRRQQQQHSNTMASGNGNANHWVSSGRSEAGVRRLLFAQQLVDSTYDDSPVATAIANCNTTTTNRLQNSHLKQHY